MHAAACWLQRAEAKSAYGIALRERQEAEAAIQRAEKERFEADEAEEHARRERAEAIAAMAAAAQVLSLRALLVQKYKY